MPTPPSARTEDLLRELAPQVLGALVRRYGHFDACEDAVQEGRAVISHDVTEAPPRPSIVDS